MSYVTSLVISLLLLLCTSMAQNASSSAPSIKSAADLDKFLAGNSLKDCQANFATLQNWANANYDRAQSLQVENTRLRRELASETKRGDRMFLGFLGAGVGLYCTWLASYLLRLVVASARRSWPVSKQKRQLIVLLMIASWMSIVSVLASNNEGLAGHPINLAVWILVYSVPALSFGGIAVWWFGRSKPEVLS